MMRWLRKGRQPANGQAGPCVAASSLEMMSGGRTEGDGNTPRIAAKVRDTKALALRK